MTKPIAEALAEQIDALLALKNETPRIPNLARELLSQAAALIQAQAEELQALKADRTDKADAWDAISKKNETIDQLREGLRPFAAEVARFGRGNEDRAVTLMLADRKAHPSVDLSVADFVRAHDLIKPKP
jgi:hypothetical protein